MSLTTITLATKDGPLAMVVDQCTPHLAITPRYVTLVDTGEKVFTGSWNLTHIPTGFELIPALTEPIDGPFLETRTSEFEAVRAFARWLEKQADLSFDDVAGKAVLDPIMDALREFYASPETWADRYAEDPL